MQGVWYRASTRETAGRLGLSGWVRNLPNGDVEVTACGAPEQLDALEAWLWEGPPHARVSDVRAEEIEYRCDEGFTVR